MGISQVPPDRALVVWEPSATAPAGYIKANGATISRSAYAWLFGRIGVTFGAGDGSTTFEIPDLRGEFLRGLDDGRGVDSGRAIGTAQGDDFKSHTHVENGLVQAGAGGGGAITISGGSVDGPATGAAGGAETRPRNVAGLYCIAYAP